MTFTLISIRFSLFSRQKSVVSIYCFLLRGPQSGYIQELFIYFHTHVFYAFETFVHCSIRRTIVRELQKLFNFFPRTCWDTT